MDNPTRILVVDDNSAFLRSASDFLSISEDMLVVGSAAGGQEALTRAPELRPHVILIDLNMRDLPGLQAIPRLRAAVPDAAVIAMTLWGSALHRQAALAAGADDFIDKASLVTDLLPAIGRVAAGRAG